MGIGLIVEVLDHAPADLTSGERMVLVVIAEWANDGTRLARQSKAWTLDTLAARAGLKRSGLKEAFRGLARKGCEVRVPVRNDKRGEPVYAFEGTAMTFVIPNLDKRGGHSPSSEGGPQHLRGVAVAPERGGHSLPLPLNSPHRSPQVTDQNSTTSSRFAPSGGGQQIPSQRTASSESDSNDGVQVEAIINEPYQPEHTTADYVGARESDRELFRQLVGDALTSDGSTFSPGTWRADQFYDAFRKWKRKRKIDWPGRMLNAIAEDSPNGGVDDWLIHLGLEPVSLATQD